MDKAKQIYETLCRALDNRSWSYEKEEENLIVKFDVNGEDFPIKLIIAVDAERQVVRLLSPLPFSMSEDKRVDGALVTCIASYGIVDGGFDYDFASGGIWFRMSQSYRGSTIGEGFFSYMMDCACAMVERYNDRFFAVSKGFMTIEEFRAKE